MAKITSDTLLIDIFELPKSEEILTKHKVPCVSCPMAQFELGNLTIGEVCKMYGIDLKRLLEDLNKEF